MIWGYNNLVDEKGKYEKILDENIIKCPCGERLFSQDLCFYKLPQPSDEYWLYAHCDKCRYDLNYQKIYRRYLGQKEQ
jgi:hypothetical protein